MIITKNHVNKIFFIPFWVLDPLSPKIIYFAENSFVKPCAITPNVIPLLKRCAYMKKNAFNELFPRLAAR